MTVVVGHPPRKTSRGVLELGVALAHAQSESLLTVTVVPSGWNVPSMARVDMEFSQWAAQQAVQAQSDASASLESLGVEVEVDYRTVSDRSVPGALERVADEVDASLVVIGSSRDGRKAHIELGSTGDRLVHSARVPVAIAPRGYSSPKGGLTRVTCAVAGVATDAGLVARARDLAAKAGIPLRLVTFAVRLDTMYPPEVGLDVEDEVALALREQAGSCITALRREGIVGDDVDAVVGQGSGWRAAVEAVEWIDGDLLVIGSHPLGALARVFLGSKATKIVRHSPVPVLVAPAE